MPVFEFVTGAAQIGGTGSTIDLDFTDNGVNFTISTTGNDNSGGFGFPNQIRYIPNGNGGTGELIITDTDVGTITFDVSSGAAAGNFAGTGTAGNITLKYENVISSFNVTFVNAGIGPNQTFNINGGTQIQFAAGGNEYSQIIFTSGSPNGYVVEILSLTAAITCYLTGTAIATPTGSIAVQDLQPGDEILTATGGTTTVNWLGVQPVDTTTATPAKAYPICFVAGSLAPNVPARDLFVSPDHAMDLGGILYNATALVNGTSIYQVGQMPQDGFTYYHIDTGSHELILAEGAASETYLDAVGREACINGHEAADAPSITEMALPRIVAKRMVPTDVTEALAARADALGLTGHARVA